MFFKLAIMCCSMNTMLLRKDFWGTSLVVQWLRLWSPNAGNLHSIPGQGSRFHMLQLKSSHVQLRILMLQLRIRLLQLKIPHATAKTLCSQINKCKQISFKKKGLSKPNVASQRGFLCKRNTESVEARVTLALDDITVYGSQYLLLKAPNLPPAIS